MASSSGKLSIRLLVLVLVLLAAFYIGRPLYWKLSATIHEIREKRQTVKEGFSKFVLDAQKSVGLVHDESDAGFVDEQHSGKATTQRILRPLKNQICEAPHSPDGLVGLETEKISSLDFTLSSSQEVELT